MKDNYYFDNAATTWPKPESVYTFMDSFFRQYGVNPGRAGHTMSIEAERVTSATRRMLASFFNFPGSSERVVFTQNATDSLNIVLYGMLQAGDHVVSTHLEHNSVIRPLNHMVRDHQIQLTRVPHDANGYIDPDDVRQALRPNTRIIVINHASNVLGTVQDIAAIGKTARQAGVTLVVDSCQTAGVLPIDMNSMLIDILVFTGHKGLFGPMGIGGIVAAEHVCIKPLRVGGTGFDSITPYQPDDYPFHLESGTLALPGIAGLYAAQKWFAELGQSQSIETLDETQHHACCMAALEYIEKKEMHCIQQLIDGFSKIPGVKIYGPTHCNQRVATLSINVGRLPADQVGEMLDADYTICVRSGLHCAPLVHQQANTLEQKGTVRFSPGYFTDQEDVDLAITAVEELATIAPVD